MPVNFDRIQVIVFVKSKEDIAKYFNLFKFMIHVDDATYRLQNDYADIATSMLRVRFYVGGSSGHSLGFRAHYVINMVQDVEFDQCVAIPISCNHSYLRDDPKWKHLLSLKD